VASAQQLIELDLLESHIITPEHVMLETEHTAPKGVSETSDLQPDMTTSNHPQGLAEQFVADQFVVVAAGANDRVRRDNPPQQCDRQANHQFAYRMDSVTCRIVDDDTASLARFLIHVIDASKCHTDQLEAGAGFDHYS